MYNLKVYIYFLLYVAFFQASFVVCFWSINKNVMFTSVSGYFFIFLFLNNWIQMSTVLIINTSHNDNYAKHNAQIITHN